MKREAPASRESAGGGAITLAKHLRRSAENLDTVAAWLDDLRASGWQKGIAAECQSFVDEEAEP